LAARTLHKLSARTVATIGDGRHGDGGGLFLVVSGNRRRWVLRYRHGGRIREAGLGSPSLVKLAEAREAADRMRAQVRAGLDPIEARKTERKELQSKVTFGQFADEVVASIEPGFRNAKHRAQWKMSIEVYAGPLRSMAIDSITVDDVLAVLKPIWMSKHETASRVRGRIERVMEAAAARRLTDRANPARWRGNLSVLLPKVAKLRRGHHAALPIADLPALMARLGQANGMSARALAFTILTASRSNETYGARWSEIDERELIWTVPADRMKSGRIHRVPLSAAAANVLEAVRPFRKDENDFIFPGENRKRTLSNMAMLESLRGLAPGTTVHGFRSTFRDWAGDDTNHSRETIEAALAHVVGDETERAYRRSDALRKRRTLMEDWAAFALAGRESQQLAA
jgi:integrase